MEINNRIMSSNELNKVALLISHATRLGMDVSGYGAADVNPSSGFTYIWLEDYPFVLFIRPCDDEIEALFTDFETGEEHEIDVGEMSLCDLYEWCRSLEAAA